MGYFRNLKEQYVACYMKRGVLFICFLYSFKVVYNIIGDSTSLRDNHIYTMEEDGNHNLWVGCVKGISIFNPANSRFSIPRIIPWNSSGLQFISDGVTIIKSVDKGKYLLAGT